MAYSRLFDYCTKRKSFEIVSLNFRLVDATPIPEWRKPFDALAEGLDSKNSRDDRAAIELFCSELAKWDVKVTGLI